MIFSENNVHCITTFVTKKLIVFLVQVFELTCIENTTKFDENAEIICKQMQKKIQFESRRNFCTRWLYESTT